MSSNELVLNWGIIGSGLIANDFCQSINSLNTKYHVLKSVSALTLEEANSFADKHYIVNRYGSFDEMFNVNENDVDNVNIVYIATINKTHKELCLKAINAGKHVLCEKPMSMFRQDQEEIFAAAKAKNVFLMEVG
jgi:predicted dehydrogenase